MDTSSLHPTFKPVADLILAAMNRAMPYGSRVRVIDGFRTPADQAHNVASGASHVGLSWHEYGLAFDFGVFEDVKTGGTPIERYVTDGSDFRYGAAAVAAKAACAEIIWGGDWQHNPDPDHLEWHPGFTMALYQMWLKAHPAPEVD